MLLLSSGHIFFQNKKQTGHHTQKTFRNSLRVPNGLDPYQDPYGPKPFAKWHCQQGNKHTYILPASSKACWQFITEWLQIHKFLFKK